MTKEQIDEIINQLRLLKNNAEKMMDSNVFSEAIYHFYDGRISALEEVIDILAKVKYGQRKES